jgi:hypothetical protein
MIVGLLLGVSFAVFFSFSTLIFLSSSNLLKENLITGAVIGPKDFASYAIIPAMIAFLISFLLLGFLIKKIKN